MPEPGVELRQRRKLQHPRPGLSNTWTPVWFMAAKLTSPMVRPDETNEQGERDEIGLVCVPHRQRSGEGDAQPSFRNIDIIIPIDLGGLHGFSVELRFPDGLQGRIRPGNTLLNHRIYDLMSRLKAIRSLGYASEARRATDTVLACIRIAEEGIREYEISTERKRDEDVNS